jgi:hypothetical protein
MVMCKHCGMDSSDAVTCEWCKRPLGPQSSARVDRPSQSPQLVRTTMDILEEEEESLRARRRNFVIAGCILLIAASCVIAWKPPIFATVTIATAFIMGMMLTHWRVIDPFSDDWPLVGILVLLTALAPAFFVFLGYIAYGIIYRDRDPNVLWLYVSFLAATTVLQIVSILAWQQGYPPGFFLKLYGAEKLSFPATAFGWIFASSMSVGAR